MTVEYRSFFDLGEVRFHRIDNVKLTYYRGPTPNFGDDLNAFIWPTLLPKSFLDEDDSELFLGIGSILWDYLPIKARKYVVGSGYGGYTAPPNIHDGSWDVIFVRGPRTGKILGLPSEKVITDGAILVRAVTLPKSVSTEVGYIPHFQRVNNGNWQEACRLSGIRMIDPTEPVGKVLAEIRGAKKVICEAMHGAIVADALRVPWVAVKPLQVEHRGKWLDWSESLDLNLRQHNLWPSNMIEGYVLATRGKRYYRGRVRDWLKSRAARPVNTAMAQLAAKRLLALAQQEPQLSRDSAMKSATERALHAIDLFVRSRAP